MLFGKSDQMLDLNEASEYLGIGRTLIDSLWKNGLEFTTFKIGRKYHIPKSELDAWLDRKIKMTVMLSKEDLLKAFKFALEINYSGHTRSDFGTARRRIMEQAVANWTQGALAEIALSIYVKRKYGVELKLDFSVHPGFITGQDITAVIRNGVENPPRKRISVKSGKENGMFLVIPQNEIERAQRVSDLFFFVRIWLQDGFIFQLFRDHETLTDIKDIIPEIEDFPSQIMCFAERGSLRRVVKGDLTFDFSGVRYVCRSGKLKNSEDDFRNFVDSL